MAFLTVAAIDLLCIKDTWGEDPPETLGEVIRMADGTLGSTERTPKRQISGDVAFRTPAEGAAFRAAISLGGSPGVPWLVTATSDPDGAMGGASLTVLARLGRIQYVRTRTPEAPDVETIYWRGPLRLIEY